MIQTEPSYCRYRYVHTGKQQTFEHQNHKTTNELRKDDAAPLSLMAVSSIKPKVEEVPSQWPSEVGEIYVPVRELGRGGFASVLLARKKNAAVGEKDRFVAIKVVGKEDATRLEVGYAHREIDILREVTHPNIMYLVEYWEPPKELHACAAVMALSYAKGPTLAVLLKIGGKLNLNFARIVAAQLVDAVTYLHSRAVIHRDIKPDNIVVSGANREQDEIWDDDSEDNNPDLVALLTKWHVTLIDFGFARALTPKDMKQKAPGRSLSGGGMDNSSGNKSLGRSTSRSFTRKMSAVGNRMFAAPEILKGIERNVDLSRHPGAISTDSYHMSLDVTQTLSEHISSYGLLVDAYSIGNTLKYMMTGVPPDEDVSEAIAAQNHPIAKFGRFLGKKMGKKKKTDAKVRSVKYRSIPNIPLEVFRLIKGCTEFDAGKRTSVRTARLYYPWIDDVLVGREVPSSGEVKYLDFVIKKEEAVGRSTSIPEEMTEAYSEEASESLDEAMPDVEDGEVPLEF
jgi:serine/threonine protein kinase